MLCVIVNRSHLMTYSSLNHWLWNAHRATNSTSSKAQCRADRAVQIQVKYCKWISQSIQLYFNGIFYTGQCYSSSTKFVICSTRKEASLGLLCLLFSFSSVPARCTGRKINELQKKKSHMTKRGFIIFHSLEQTALPSVGTTFWMYKEGAGSVCQCWYSLTSHCTF